MRVTLRSSAPRYPMVSWTHAWGSTPGTRWLCIDAINIHLCIDAIKNAITVFVRIQPQIFTDQILYASCKSWSSTLQGPRATFVPASRPRSSLVGSWGLVVGASTGSLRMPGSSEEAAPLLGIRAAYPFPRSSLLCGPVLSRELQQRQGPP